MAISLVALYLGFYYLNGIDFFTTDRKYYAIYDNVDKLMESNQVYINGFAVGRVNSITILTHHHNKVAVEMLIRSGITLTDSTVAVLSSDFLGNKSILLNMDKVGKPLVPGDTVTSGLEKGLADLLEKADPVADNLQATLRKLNTILDDLASHTGSLDTIFTRFKETPALLNRTMINANLTIDSLSHDLRLFVNNANNSIKDVQPSFRNFRAFSDSLRAVQLGTTVAKLNATIARINALLSKADSGRTTMGKLMTEDTLYVNMNNLLLSLDSLSHHLNTNPKHFFAPLGKSKRKIERDLEKQRKD